MPEYVIIAHEKHGTFTYESALACLRQRVTEGYWYFDDDAIEADTIVTSDAEDAAWRFLNARKDHEYEYVEKSAVRS